MAQVKLSKLLKVKNRLVGRLQKVSSDIHAYNSVLEEQVGQVDVGELVALRQKLSNCLVIVKDKIHVANVDIVTILNRISEIKDQINLLQNLNTMDGKHKHGYENSNVTYVAHLKKNEVNLLIRAEENALDVLQDEVDAFNHSTLVEISQDVLDLAS